MPRRLQIDFARRVQEHADASGAEVEAATLWSLFESAYLGDSSGVRVVAAATRGSTTTLDIEVGGVLSSTEHDGVGPVEALVDALTQAGRPLEIVGFHQSNVGSGTGTDALTLIEYRTTARSGWAAGRSRSVLQASLDAVARAAALGEAD